MMSILSVNKAGSHKWMRISLIFFFLGKMEYAYIGAAAIASGDFKFPIFKQANVFADVMNFI